MFKTTRDAANRKAVRAVVRADLNPVGFATSPGRASAGHDEDQCAFPLESK